MTPLLVAYPPPRRATRSGRGPQIQPYFQLTRKTVGYSTASGRLHWDALAVNPFKPGDGTATIAAVRGGGRIHVALVGGGRIADLHAPGYLEDPRARLYALCDLDAAVRARREREWGLERAYADSG